MQNVTLILRRPSAVAHVKGYTAAYAYVGKISHACFDDDKRTSLLMSLC